MTFKYVDVDDNLLKVVNQYRKDEFDATMKWFINKAILEFLKMEKYLDEDGNPLVDVVEDE